MKESKANIECLQCIIIKQMWIFNLMKLKQIKGTQRMHLKRNDSTGKIHFLEFFHQNSVFSLFDIIIFHIKLKYSYCHD